MGDAWWLVAALGCAVVVGRLALRRRRRVAGASEPPSPAPLVLRVVSEPTPGAHSWRVPTCKCGGTRWRAERVLRTGSLVARCLGCSVVAVWEREGVGRE